MTVEIAAIGRIDLDLFAHIGAPLRDLWPDLRQGLKRELGIGQQVLEAAPLTVGLHIEAVATGLLRRQGQLIGLEPCVPQGVCLDGKAFCPFRTDTAEGQTARGEALIGIVGSQGEAIFGATGKHAIGLGHATCDQIIDHDANIGLITRKGHRIGPRGLTSGIEARH